MQQRGLSIAVAIAIATGAAVAATACGQDNVDSPPDAGPDAPFNPSPDADPNTPGLKILAVSPAAGHTVAIDELAQYRVSIVNLGNTTGPITATLTGSTDFSILSSTCTTLILAATCELQLKLVPSVIGAIDAQLTLSAQPGGSVTAMLHGTGLQKNVLSLPGRIDFHGRAVGETSAPMPVTVTNTGSVTTGPLTVSLGAGKFSLQSDGCTGQSVPSQGTCLLSLVYAPTGTAPLGTGDDLASLSVRGTPGGIASSTVAGYGATILMDEWQYLFPNTTIGATSAPRTFTLTNTQNISFGPLTTDPQFVGASFVLSQDNCNGITLAAHASCTYVVAFRPTTTNLAAGAIYVTAPDVGSLRASASVQYGGTGQ